jgi:hypothetical protein
LDVHLAFHSPGTSDFAPLRHCTHLRTIQRLETIMFHAVLSALLSCLMPLPSASNRPQLTRTRPQRLRSLLLRKPLPRKTLRIHRPRPVQGVEFVGIYKGALRLHRPHRQPVARRENPPRPRSALARDGAGNVGLGCLRLPGRPLRKEDRFWL